MAIFLLILGITLLATSLAIENAQAIERGWTPLWKRWLGAGSSGNHHGSTVDEVQTVEAVGKVVLSTENQNKPQVQDHKSETLPIAPEDLSDDLHEARTMTEVGTKLDLARAYVDMGNPAGARSILEEVLEENDKEREQAEDMIAKLAE